MKIRKLLAVSLLMGSFALASCSKKPSDPDNSLDRAEGARVLKNSGAQILEKCAEPSASSLIRRPTRSKTDSEMKMFLQTPGILCYLSGLMYEETAFDIAKDHVSFTGPYTYHFGGSSPVVQTIRLDVHVEISKEENKFSFYGYQTVAEFAGSDSYMIIHANYDFEAGKLGSFSLCSGSLDGEDLKRMDAVNYDASEEKLTYVEGEPQTSETASAFKADVAKFDALTKVTLSGDDIKTCQKHFVSTQKYADEVLHQDTGIEDIE